MIQFWGERHLKNNRHSSLPLTPPHPWICFKPSVLPFSGQMSDMVRRSRGRVTTQVQDNRIRTRHLRNRRLPATRTAAVTIGSHNRLSNKTATGTWYQSETSLCWSRLDTQTSSGPFTMVPRHRRWLARQWNQLLFSDESRFTLEKADGRVRVYQRVGERYLDACVTEVDRFRRGSVMVWGGINHQSKTDLVVIRSNLNAQGYINDVLRPVVVPFINNQNGPVIFQQDNARPHMARVTTQFLQGNNINVMQWPSMSPDLSPIEQVWDELDKRVRRRQIQPNTLAQLEQVLVHEWNNLPRNVIRRYLRSMRRRCIAIINAAGGHTRSWLLLNFFRWPSGALEHRRTHDSNICRKQ